MKPSFRWRPPGSPIRSGLGFQIGAYMVIGTLQLLFDTVLFIALGVAGLAVVPANLLSRAAAALLGFWLNGHYTFARQGHGGAGPGGGALPRYVLAWTLLTAIGTGVLHLVDARFGLGSAWLAKPLVEVVLALLGFLSLKHFVFPARRG